MAYVPTTVERSARQRRIEAIARIQSRQEEKEFRMRSRYARKYAMASLVIFALGLVMGIASLYMHRLWEANALMGLAFTAWIAGEVSGVIAVRALRSMRRARIGMWLNLGGLLFLGYIIFLLSMRGGLAH